MQILVIANLPPYVLGGAENQVARLVKAWRDLGHQVEVAGHRIPDGVLRFDRMEIRTHRIALINNSGRVGRAISYFVSIARLLGKIKSNFDLIYCRGLGDGAISICLLKALGVVRLPLVACPMNARGAGDAFFLRSIPGWRMLVPLVNRHCNAINIIAPAILSDLFRLGIDRPRIYHIPNGIKLGEPVCHLRSTTTRRMIWTGRMAPQKGIDILLNALSNAAAAGREFSFEIVGDGPDKATLIKQCQELSLEKMVHFTGSIAIDAVRAKLANSDVFVLPSRYEGMSNSALEAMEVGLPVLLTRCGGIDTYIDDDIGWTCKPDDVRELTRALLGMLDTPEEKIMVMGEHARRIVESHFQIEKIAKKNVELFEHLIDSPYHLFDRSGLRSPE